MPDGAGTEVGVLTTRFVGDISGIANAVRNVKAILRTARSDIGKIKFSMPVDKIKSSLGKSISTGINASISKGLAKSDLSKGVNAAFSKGILQSFRSTQKLLPSGDLGFTHKPSTAGQPNFRFRQKPPPMWQERGMVGARGGELAGPFAAWRPPPFNMQKVSFDLKKIRGAVDDLSGSLLKLGAGLTGIVSGPLAMFSKSSLMISSEATEWQNVFDQSFIKVLPKAQKAAKDFAKEFALSSKTANFLLGDIGELAGGIGFSAEKSLELSVAINKLSGDLTSFRNLKGGIQATTHALFMGVMGNSRSLKRLGIAINQRMPEFKKLTNELMRLNKYTWQQARFQAVLEIAMKQTSFAVGDYQRTYFTFANSLRRVEERSISLRQQFGRILIEGLGLNWILTGVAKAVSMLATGLKYIPAPFKTIIGLLTVSLIALGPLVVILGLLGFAITSSITGYKALMTILPLIAAKLKMASAAVATNTLALNVNSFSLSLILAKMKAIVAFIFARMIPAIIAMTAKLMLNPLVLAAVAAIASIKYAYGELSNMNPIKPKLDMSEFKSKKTRSLLENLLNPSGVSWEDTSKKMKSGWEKQQAGVKTNRNVFFASIKDFFNMFTRHSRESLASGMMGGKERLDETYRKYFLEVADIWNMEKSGKRIAEMVAKWEGIDMKNIAAPFAGLKDKKIKPTIAIPKLASAAIAGTAEGVLAMNKPTGDAMLQKADQQIALLSGIKAIIGGGRIEDPKEILGLV